MTSNVTTSHPTTHDLPVQVFSDEATLAEAFAQRIADEIAIASQEGRRYLLGCPGGRTPLSTYRALGRIAAKRQLDLSHLVIVMMDEYLVNTPDGLANAPAKAHFSCHRCAEEDIAGVLNAGLPNEKRISPDNVWFPDPVDTSAYDVKLREAGGIDLFILASGAGDGHVAFNPPGSAMDSVSRIIPLPDTTRRDNMVTFPEFRSLEDVPSYGVSVGLGTIASLSRSAVLLMHGLDKQHAVQRLLEAGDFDESWPATIIYRCQQPQVLIDQAAAMRMHGEN